MFLLVFIIILLSNYIIVADIKENSKLIYFTLLAIIGVIIIISKILG